MTAVISTRDREAPSDGELTEQLGPLRKVTIGEEVCPHSLRTHRTHAGRIRRVGEQTTDRVGVLIEVVRILEEPSGVTRDDLVDDSPDSTADHGPRLPHRFDHCESEALGEALLHDDLRVPLE